MECAIDTSLPLNLLIGFVPSLSVSSRHISPSESAHRFRSFSVRPVSTHLYLWICSLASFLLCPSRLDTSLPVNLLIGFVSARPVSTHLYLWICSSASFLLCPSRLDTSLSLNLLIGFVPSLSVPSRHISTCESAHRFRLCPSRLDTSLPLNLLIGFVLSLSVVWMNTQETHLFANKAETQTDRHRLRSESESERQRARNGASESEGKFFPKRARKITSES